MTANQIYSIINEVAQQSFGSKAISVVDLTSLIAMGDTVLSSSSNKEEFLNTLVDRIGKTIIGTRNYSPQTQNLIIDEMQFGAVIQKTYVEPFDANENTSHDVTDGTDVNLFIVAKPSVTQKLFSVKDTWQFEVTVPDYQMNTAFTSSESMASFINSIYVTLENSLNISLENMVNMTIANFLAEKIADSKATTPTGVNAINLLSEYNTTFSPSTTLTVAKALQDKDFLRFATTQIKLIMSRLQRMSELYNMEGYKRFTPKDKMHVLMLTDFVASVNAYLESDTYHNELVALPNYNEVSYWQGLGTDGEFTNTSAINIETSNGVALNYTGILGVIFDEDAMGVMVQRRNALSDHSNKYEVTHTWQRCDYGYFNDLSENGVVFFIED